MIDREIHPEVVYLVRMGDELVPIPGRKMINMLKAARAAFSPQAGRPLHHDNVTTERDDND